VIPKETVFDVVPIEFVYATTVPGNFTGTIDGPSIANGVTLNYYRIGYLEVKFDGSKFPNGTSSPYGNPDIINVRIVSYNYQYFNSLLLATSENSTNWGNTTKSILIDINQLPVQQRLTITIRADYFT